jgi:putative ABC transport system permease protein
VAAGIARVSRAGSGRAAIGGHRQIEAWDYLGAGERSAGVYALASFSVAARQREMAIRVAIGATRADVARLFADADRRLALVGWCAGSVLFALIHQLLTNVLFGVSAFDPQTHAAALLAVFAVVVLAGCKPVVSATLASPWPLLGCE